MKIAANSGFFEQAVLAQKEMMGKEHTVEAQNTPAILDAFWEGETQVTHGRSETKCWSSPFFVSARYLLVEIDFHWGMILPKQ